ncbi:Uncharacterised protein [Mycobacteroides abscessus subsp. abscessus]|nr:Uncharacterised protein [Mycobacteroides abscessus subsp. abscessus]
MTGSRRSLAARVPSTSSASKPAAPADAMPKASSMSAIMST